MIIRALYGRKRAGTDYWRHVQYAMDEMGFESCKAEPDVWFSSAMKDDGRDYYQYVLLYTDDILTIMQNPEDFIRHDIGKRVVVKPNSIGPPTKCLGNKVSYVTLENVQSAWIFSSSQDISDPLKNVIDTLFQEARTLPKHGKYLWNSN